MNAVLAGLAALGSAWDRVAAATRRTPGQVRAALGERACRRPAILVGLAVLVAYLVAIGDLAVSTSGDRGGTALVATAPANVFSARAPYLFEPVLALHPTGHLAVFVSPVNIALGSVVAALAALNVAVARYAAARAGCRRRGYGRLAGALPALLLGFACCTPTVVLALGTSTGAAILPLLLPIRSIFYPLTLTLLAATLIWGAARVSPAAPAVSLSLSGLRPARVAAASGSGEPVTPPRDGDGHHRTV